MQFLITNEMEPGIVRAAGLIKPGTSVSGALAKGNLPKLSLRLQPLDAEAYAALVADHGAEKVKAAWGSGPVPAPVEAQKPDNAKSPAQAAEDLAGVGKKVRASDSK